jgi:ferritin-like metal-binding protein YciE
MAGLIAEASDIMDDCEIGPQCDAGIISAAQKIEHYEIATYGTLREFAETLGLSDAEKLLLEILNEEKSADQKLTDIAVKMVNMNAAVKPA